MKSKLRRGFVALLFLPLLSPLGNAAATVPEWLSAANLVQTGDFGEGSAAVFIERREEFTVDSSGHFVRKERGAIRIKSRRAAEQYVRISGYENADQSVLQIQTWTIGRDGHIVASEKKDVVTTSGYGDFELFSDSRFKSIVAPGVQDGSLLGYEIRTEGIDRLHSESFRLEEDIPVWLSELRISVPSGSLRYFVNHPDRVEVVNGLPHDATFRSQKRPPIPREERMPPFHSVAGTVFVNYDPNGNAAIDSWQEAGKAVHPLFSEARKATPEIESEVARLIEGKADVLRKAEAVSDFVSHKIRYVAIEIGIGGIKPHSAADVYRFKYGDCKDKATLLLTMLDQIGVRGYPALVGTRRGIEAEPGSPTLTSFNHMIVAIPVGGELRGRVEHFPAYDAANQILWVDPTSDSHPLGELPAMDQGVYVLVDYGDRGEIRKTPESPAHANGMDFQAQLQLDASGKGIATVRVRYAGGFSASRHSRYRDQSVSELKKGFEAEVARYANEPTLTHASITGLDNDRVPLVENFSFRGDFSSVPAGDSWFFQPLFLSEMSAVELAGKPRVHDWDQGAPYHVRGEYQIELPAGMRIERLPEPVRMQSEFGTLEIEYSSNGQTLTAIHAITFTLSRIPAEKYPEFREFVNREFRVGRQRLRMVKN